MHKAVGTGGSPAIKDLVKPAADAEVSNVLVLTGELGKVCLLVADPWVVPSSKVSLI